MTEDLLGEVDRIGFGVADADEVQDQALVDGDRVQGLGEVHHGFLV